jgi:hypothetical protein
LERDKGIELSSAQIELRLLATRALNGGWNDVPLPAGRKESGVGAGGGGAGAVKVCSRGSGAAAAGAASTQGDGVVIDDAEEPAKGVEGAAGAGQTRHREGAAAGGVAHATGEVSGSGEKGSGRHKALLERVRAAAAGDDSEDDDLPLAVKQVVEEGRGRVRVVGGWRVLEVGLGISARMTTTQALNPTPYTLPP